MCFPDRSGKLSLAIALDARSAPLFIGAVCGLTAVALAVVVGQNSSEQALLAARWTARAALPLFLATYLASSLARLCRNDLTRVILSRRRQWGLGFTLAHTIHLAALAVNVLIFGPSREPETLVGGGLAYAFIYMMALTSNNRSQKFLGKYWKWLHRIGIHYIWTIFAISYASRIADPDMRLTGLVFTPVMLGALALRLYARFATQPKSNDGAMA